MRCLPPHPPFPPPLLPEEARPGSLADSVGNAASLGYSTSKLTATDQTPRRNSQATPCGYLPRDSMPGLARRPNAARKALTTPDADSISYMVSVRDRRPGCWSLAESACIRRCNTRTSANPAPQAREDLPGHFMDPDGGEHHHESHGHPARRVSRTRRGRLRRLRVQRSVETTLGGLRPRGPQRPSFNAREGGSPQHTPFDEPRADPRPEDGDTVRCFVVTFASNRHL